MSDHVLRSLGRDAPRESCALAHGIAQPDVVISNALTLVLSTACTANVQGNDRPSQSLLRVLFYLDPELRRSRDNTLPPPVVSTGMSEDCVGLRIMKEQVVAGFSREEIGRLVVAAPLF